MRSYVPLVAVPIAFVAGLLSTHLFPLAIAQSPVPGQLEPQIIDLTAMTDAKIGPLVANVGTLRTRTLVATPQGTISIQSGDVPKHTHTYSLEVQYIIAGQGTFWLGNQQHTIHPGDLIIIPPGTVHAGDVATVGRFKAIAIKLPPQQSGDMHLVP